MTDRERQAPPWTRRALVVAAVFLAVGLWMVLDALGISPPPLSNHWPLFLILGGLASGVDFLAISRRPGALGLAVTGAGLGIVFYLLVLEAVQWTAPRLWIPGILLTFGLALLSTWGADPDRSPRTLVAGTVLTGLAVTFWSWVEIPMPLFWGLLFLCLGGVILYSVFRRRGADGGHPSRSP
ncbi:MAG: hypothetical protein R3234_02125 [Thermoanaerobaculia bacterium]|nr:hypothetical protein [Thermoanaerobaculia bacterium]